MYDHLNEFSMTRFILKSMLAALTASLVALPLQARDTIQIVGSSKVYPFATVVAEKLGKKRGKTPKTSVRLSLQFYSGYDEKLY